MLHGHWERPPSEGKFSADRIGRCVDMQVNEIAQHAVTCWMRPIGLSMVFADGARYDVPRRQKHRLPGDGWGQL